MTRLLVLLWLLGVAAAGAAAPGVLGALEGGPPRESAVYFLRTGESLVLSRKSAGKNPVRWFVITPELRAYDNRPGPQPRLDPIRYRRTPMAGAPSPRLTLSFATPGTRYFCAGDVTPERFATAEPLHRKYVGQIVQIVVRAGDTYVDYLGELFGTPFVMGPAVVPGGWHQTDQRVASDCAAFATYGRRRMGLPVPFAGPEGIVRFLRPLITGPLAPPGRDGLYRDARGRCIRIGGEGLLRGDIVHFGAQVSVFFADRGVRGVLDADDLLLQSWRTTPYITRIRDGGFFQHAICLYRWRSSAKLARRFTRDAIP